MPRIKFTQDRKTVETVPQEFKAGEVYELPAESCERWIRRGAAIEFQEADAERQDAPAETPKKRRKA